MPKKDEVADYLVKYVEKFKLPVHMGETVNHLSRTESEFEITTNKRILKCDKDIVATRGLGSKQKLAGRTRPQPARFSAMSSSRLFLF